MKKIDKPNNINDINPKTTEAEEIIGRLKDALGVTSDGQLANYLGISRQNIGASRKRQDVPPGWIYKVAALSGCSMDWLRFGQGAKTRGEYETETSYQAGRIASPQTPFRGGPGPGDVGQGPQDADTTGFGEAVEMLAKIYRSEDKLLISTINANIRAFCEAIDRKKRERQSVRELESLKKRLSRKDRSC
jgi:hypothetical protein